mgnify:CR=1 FL=1
MMALIHDVIASVVPGLQPEARASAGPSCRDLLLLVA